ncbi:MAG: amidase, partial [Acidobacteriota bacterium]|nr:amidase [Acidobacteriota bacterium]
MHDELLDGDACAQAAAIRGGELSCRELIEATIRRIESLNPELNCVVAVRFEAALQEAREFDGRGVFAGPLAGVPVLLKDLGQQVAGLAQTDGSRAERNGPPSEDSALVARYRQGGLIPLGKTTSPEFGNHSTSEPLVHGPARNPWDAGRSTGGSSGGSGAAVGARMVPVAGASDGAGSIRIPASCCGVFGLKPSRGRIELANSEGKLAQLAVTHAVSRSVRDSAALLDLSSAPERGGTVSLPLPRVPFSM